MRVIETHCHLNSDRFSDDLEATIQRAHDAGIEKMIVVGYDMPSSEAAVQLSDRFETLYAAVAIHPHDSRLYDAPSELRLLELAGHPKVVAIGEIGLDYHYDFSGRDEQFHAFRRQLALANEVGLPIIVHCREAYDDVLTLLEKESSGYVSGVMHCWAGTVEEMARTVKLGMHVGFGGVVTFKNAELNRECAVSAPSDRLLVETDAPYLAPVPFRGKRNEPAYCVEVLRSLASIRGVEPELLGEETTRNAYQLFQKLK